jgi:hypothetical protein
MDTKLIKQYGEDILCYRLRTARQKKRMVYEDFDKYLIQLDKEEYALNEQKRNLGWEPLIPPVQKGWKRFFVLRDDVAVSKNAEFFQAILNKINTYQWSYRKDFKVKKRRYGKKKYVVKNQKLLQPCQWYFAKLDFTDNEKALFHEIFEIEKRGKTPIKRYVFKEPWRFRLKVSPNIITKVRIKDGELESKIDRIENYIKRNDFRKRQEKITRGYFKYKYWDNLEKYNEINPFVNKPLIRIMDELKAEGLNI